MREVKTHAAKRGSVFTAAATSYWVRDLDVQLALPIVGHAAGRPRYGLIRRMRVRRRQTRPCKHFSGSVIVEPRLPRLETRDDRMARTLIVLGRVLVRRRIAATNVPALGAATQVQPPGAGRETFDATHAARLDRWIDAVSSAIHTFRRLVIGRPLTYRRGCVADP